MRVEAAVRSTMGYRIPVPHISEDLLDQYVLGRLPDDQAAPMEEHLLLCPECQDRLQLTDDFIKALRAVGRGKANDLLKH